MRIKDMFWLILGKVAALLNKFLNYTSGIYYQADGDDKIIYTTGIDTYVGNKVDIPLTVWAEVGGIKLDPINKWIINNSGIAKRMLFDGVSSLTDPSAPNMLVHFAIFINGNEIQDQTQSFTKLESLTGANTLNAATGVDLDPGDYMEVYCKTNKLDGSFTNAHIQLRFIECPRLSC